MGAWRAKALLASRQPERLPALQPSQPDSETRCGCAETSTPSLQDAIASIPKQKESQTSATLRQQCSQVPTLAFTQL